jgi:hypothetical protein
VLDGPRGVEPVRVDDRALLVDTAQDLIGE